MHPTLEKLHLTQAQRPINFQVGDVVRVHYKITEGNKQRIQVYEGTVIAIKNTGAGKSFTVRRISYDVGVERIFPLYSPTIEKIEKVRSNKVRRSKLYFLREKTGKKARLKEIKRKEVKDSIFQKAETLRQANKAPVTESAVEESIDVEQAAQSSQETQEQSAE